MRNLDRILLKDLQYFCDSFCEKYLVPQSKFYMMLDYAVLEMQKVIKNEQHIRREAGHIASDMQTTKSWPIDLLLQDDY